jgi:hypothetical protein
VVVAINPGHPLLSGITRQFLVTISKKRCAPGRSRLGSNIDDLSLLITAVRLPAIHPAQWISALDAERWIRTARADLDICFATGRVRQIRYHAPGMTGNPIHHSSRRIRSVAQKPGSSGQRQHVPILSGWFHPLGQPIGPTAHGPQEQTGGKFFTFTGDETLPSPEEYFEPLRHIYSLEYESGVSTGGTHQVIAQIETGEASIETPPASYEIEIQPPKPAFVSPPLEIERSALADGDSGPESNQADGGLAPQKQRLQVVFEFPDGRLRSLVYSALLVDGTIVAENSHPPLDQFTWELETYTTSGLHQLQVQARDALGLTGSSVEIPVQVSVDESTLNPLGGFQQSLPIIGGLMLALAGAVLLLVLVIGGKIRPRAHRVARNRRRSDPVTQPVHFATEPSPHRRAGWANRLQWPQRAAGPQAFAYLYTIHDRPDDDSPFQSQLTKSLWAAIKGCPRFCSTTLRWKPYMPE